MTNKTNKILSIHQDTLKVLEFLANAEGRSVKNYMERVLTGHANDNEELYKKSKSSKK